MDESLEEEIERELGAMEEDGLENGSSNVSSLEEVEEGALGRIAIPGEEIFLSSTDSNLQMYIPEDLRDAVTIGQYVVVPLDYSDYNIFGKIERLSYSKRDELDDLSEVHSLIHARRVGEEEYVEVAKIDPISMIGNKGESEEVRLIPKPNAIVRQVQSEGEVRSGLDIPDKGLFLGYVSVGGEKIRFSEDQTIGYYLIDSAEQKGEPLIFTHLLIAGMTGRGKTHLAKNFLRQIVGSRYRTRRGSGPQREASLVIIDPENEYHELSSDPDGEWTAEQERDLRMGEIKYGGVDELEVFAADEEEATYSGGSSYSNFSLPFSLVQDFPYLLATGGLNERQYDGLTLLIAQFFNEKSQGNYDDFLDFVKDEQVKKRFTEETGKIHSSTYRSLLRRVDKGYLRRIFDRPSVPLTDIYDQVFAEGKVSVFPTNHLSTEAERVVVLAVMSMIAESKTRSVPTAWGKQLEKLPLILAVDEAHSYLTSPEAAQEREIVNKFDKAARQGRKNRLGLVLITQNPLDLSEDVLTNVNTRVLLGMDRKMAEKAGAPKEYLNAVPYFERGRMVVNSPDNSHPLELKGLSRSLVKHK